MRKRRGAPLWSAASRRTSPQCRGDTFTCSAIGFRQSSPRTALRRCASLYWPVRSLMFQEHRTLRNLAPLGAKVIRPRNSGIQPFRRTRVCEDCYNPMRLKKSCQLKKLSTTGGGCTLCSLQRKDCSHKPRASTRLERSLKKSCPDCRRKSKRYATLQMPCLKGRSACVDAQSSRCSQRRADAILEDFETAGGRIRCRSNRLILSTLRKWREDDRFHQMIEQA